MAETHDVVVVGAGLAGASVAWHLAGELGVLLLEKGPQPGAEATAQNAGMVRRMSDDAIERALAMRSWDFFQAPGDDWAATPPSRKVGAFLGAIHEPHELYDAAAYLRSAGVRVEACDRAEELAPAMAGAPLLSGWYLPDERVADAHSLVSGYLRGARARGTQVRCGVQVTGWLRSGNRIEGVETTSGPIYAGKVVLAAGAWSSALAAKAGLHRPLVPIARTLLISSPHRLSFPEHPWCWLEDAGLYVRPEAGGWLFSPCDERPQWPAPEDSSWGALEQDRAALAAAKLEAYVPSLADLKVRRGWMGLRTFAPDRRPLLGKDPEAEGLWWAAGLGGAGVTCSAAIGEAVATWMRGGKTDWLDRASVQPGRAAAGRWLIHPSGDKRRGRLVGNQPPGGHPEPI